MRLIDLFESAHLTEASVPLSQGHRAVKDLRVESVFKLAQKGTVRGLVHGRNIWWWPAQAGTHGDVAHMLGFQNYVNYRLMIYKQNDELRLDGVPVDIHNWHKYVAECPQLAKLTQSDQLYFYAGSDGWVQGPEFVEIVSDSHVSEAWSKKYKKSINCNNPKGFSQRAHCAGRKARQAHKKTRSSSVNESVLDVTTYKNWIRHTPDSLHTDWSEYVHKQDAKWRWRADHIGARWPLFTDITQFKQALDQALVVNVDELGDVENLTKNASLDSVKHMVSGYQNPRDVDHIVMGFTTHSPLPLPIILKGNQGMWIQAGNTRQAVSRVLGITPQALLVDVRS